MKQRVKQGDYECRHCTKAPVDEHLDPETLLFFNQVQNGRGRK
ncbi:MAG TPA: hypothetical protein VLA54_03465 [Acidimicrobiia bacterium]|nr:hypothetical protein [Acidimicrobiia bacterium]